MLSCLYYTIVLVIQVKYMIQMCFTNCEFMEVILLNSKHSEVVTLSFEACLVGVVRIVAHEKDKCLELFVVSQFLSLCHICQPVLD